LVMKTTYNLHLVIVSLKRYKQSLRKKLLEHLIYFV
jgi:hypothetical protein